MEVKTQNLARKLTLRLNSPTNLEPSTENAGQIQLKGKPPRTEQSPQYLPKGQGVRDETCKNKQTQTGQIANSDGHIREDIGGEATLPINPK